MSRNYSPKPLARRDVLALGGAMTLMGASYAWRRYDLGARLVNPFAIGQFNLPPVIGLKDGSGKQIPGFSHHDLDVDKPTLVSLFASWCGYCREERPLVKDIIQKTGARAFGVMVKDDSQDAIDFFDGDTPPFKAIGDDSSGYFMRMMGARGVPATFVFASSKKITFKSFGVLDEQVVEEELFPALKA